MPEQTETPAMPTSEMPEVEEPTVDLRYDDNTPIFNGTVDDLRDQLTSLTGEQAEDTDGDDSSERDQN